MLISSYPNRGDKVVREDGRLMETFSKFISDLVRSNNQDNPLKNYSATAVPVVGNNASEGYTVGSEWIYLGIVYKLVSFTITDANWVALN